MTNVAKGHQGLKGTVSVPDPDLCQPTPGSVLRSELSEAGVDLRVISESR